ncbi:Peptidase M23 family protein [Brochothrix thermosphacta]|uniref:murein hydrolase activator EnvC family protein n=1 Tax=Brochothrix thermosphacta TaxID=2756 RepID=UPI000D10719C|nr:M23 family metallopeptidase [Brochothrix thermosphacta]SOC27122.1 Peptidase M23 family protein [Brochothrix thermosphacta]
MIKKLLTVTLITGLVAPIMITAVKADTYDDQIKSIDIQAKTTKEQLVELTDKIKENQTESKKLISDIKKKQEESDKLATRSLELEEKMEKREGVLIKQARALQTNGQDVNYVDFVLNSESVTDAIARVSVISRLVSANREMFDTQKNDKKEVDTAATEMNKIMKIQRENIAKIETNAIDLKEQEATKEAVVAKLATEKTTIQSKKQAEIVRVAAEKADKAAKAASLAAKKAAESEKTNAIEDEKVEVALMPEVEKEAPTKTVAPPVESSKPSGQQNVKPETEQPSPPTGSGYIRPSSAPISSHYGPRSGLDSSGFHKGTDFGGAQGSPIYASKSGKVVLVQNDGAPVSGYGMATIIQHDDGNYTLYAHQSSQSVSVGQSVTQGQVIGGMGSTGQSTGTHLHFEIRTSLYGGIGNVLNPELFF